MSKFVTAVKKFFRKDEGASLAEYGLLLALIAVACVGALTALGGKLSDLFTSIQSSL